MAQTETSSANPQALSRQPTVAIDAETNTISLTASQSSKITNVNLYSGRAEITRQFAFPVKQGQNQVVILGLPDSLQQDSVRVEGRGKATIHDVAISRTPQESNSYHRGKFGNPLERKREETKKVIRSVEEARAALNTYLGTIKAHEVDPDKFATILDHHETLARKFDLRILDLENELSELALQAGMEKMKAAEGAGHRQTWQISINLWAKVGEEVEVRIQYVVSNADWSASYDIRADTQSHGKNITIVYKAVIMQNTGESWEGVPLTLETTNPTLGLNLPELQPWNIGVSYPAPGAIIMPQMTMAAFPAQGPSVIIAPSIRSRSRSRSRSPPILIPAMNHVHIGASNKGGVAATFQIPGYIIVPSDALKHNVVIAKLEFDAALLWYTIPKVDAKVYIKAKIKNESEYRLISGPANVYVDGSFIATTSMPAVSPEETFDFSLGLDHAIRITYHPREKKAAQTGFVKKSNSTSYNQRITLLNTKSTPIANLKVVDSVPVSQDERIEVKLINPILPLPVADSATADGDGDRDRDSVGSSFKGIKIGNSKQKIMRVLLPSQSTKGVVAQWDGTGDPDVDQQTVGKNGRVSWFVSLAPQECVTLALKWDVSFPERLSVYGI